MKPTPHDRLVNNEPEVSQIVEARCCSFGLSLYGNLYVNSDSAHNLHIMYDIILYDIRMTLPFKLKPLPSNWAH